MAKWINTSRDGVLFINCLRPLVKAANTVPRPVKLFALGAAVGIGCGYGVYRLFRQKRAR